MAATCRAAIRRPINGPYAVRVFLNDTIVPMTITAAGTADGGSVVSNAYQLSASEIALPAATDVSNTQDGFGTSTTAGRASAGSPCNRID